MISLPKIPCIYTVYIWFWATPPPLHQTPVRLCPPGSPPSSEPCWKPREPRACAGQARKAPSAGADHPAARAAAAAAADGGKAALGAAGPLLLHAAAVHLKGGEAGAPLLFGRQQ